MDIIMCEESMNTKSQIYYNNKHASTPQASKRKKGKSDEDNVHCTLDYREVETHTQNKIT